MGGFWEPWTEEDKETAIKLKASGMKHRLIAEQLGKTQSAVENFITRLRRKEKAKDEPPKPKKRKKPMPKYLDPAIEAKRREIYNSGATDKQAALALNMITESFYSWRRMRGLPPNPSNEKWVRPEKIEVAKERVVLKAEDVPKYYNYNDNSKIRNSEKIMLKVDINHSIDNLPEPKMPRCEGPIGGIAGMSAIIGSKWTTDRTWTIGKQKDHADSIRRLARHG